MESSGSYGPLLDLSRYVPQPLSSLHAVTLCPLTGIIQAAGLLFSNLVIGILILALHNAKACWQHLHGGSQREGGTIGAATVI